MSLSNASAALLASLAAPLLAADLGPGDPAPELKVAKWLSGKEVKIADGKDKNIFVIEFWATWCGPCIQTIPHLTRIANRFEKDGLIVVGVSTDGEETRDRVEPFVKRMGKKMGYRVAIDDGGATGKAFMEAAGAEHIPHAFLIGKDGKIAWHGHPIVDGLDIRIAEMVGDKAYAESARKIADLRATVNRQLEEDKEGKWDAVLETLDKLIPLEPEEQGLLLFKYKVLAAGKKDRKAAAAWAEDLVKKVESHEVLDQLAWGILDDEESEERDTKLALAAARKANDLAKGEDWSVLDTLARAHFETGDAKQAAELQKKAIAIAEKDEESSGYRPQLRQSLERYEAGPPAR